jgi:two-component system response regulator NreC
MDLYTSPRMITLLIADDHAVVRQGLQALLVAEPDLQLVGATGNGGDVAALVDELRPDVLLLDLMMPGTSGLEVLRQLQEKGTATRVVVLSMSASEPHVAEAFRRGAMGYVLKESSAQELIEAIRQAFAGRRYVSAPLSERMVDAYLHRLTTEGPADVFDVLTDREKEVLQLVANGSSNREVAERLEISIRTAETHRAHVMQKLGLRNQNELIRYAVRRGLIRVEE